MKYRKKPVVIEAIRFFDTPSGLCALSEFGLPFVMVDYHDPKKPVLKIETLEGVMNAQIGDFIIKGINGEFYPCKSDIFEKTYEKVEE